MRVFLHLTFVEGEVGFGFDFAFEAFAGDVVEAGEIDTEDAELGREFNEKVHDFSSVAGVAFEFDELKLAVR